VVWVSGPTARIMDRLDEIAFATRDAAREISERIRGRERWSRRAPSPPGWLQTGNRDLGEFAPRSVG
jgi:hypothetical protein